MFLFALQISQSQGNYIPNTFHCHRDSPAQKESVLSEGGEIEVDLTILFCGKIIFLYDYFYKVDRFQGITGFYARPKDHTPASVFLNGVLLEKPPCNENDYAIYDKPNFANPFNPDTHLVQKFESSGIWPTDMTAEEIVNTVLYMYKLCG